MDRVIHSNY